MTDDEFKKAIAQWLSAITPFIVHPTIRTTQDFKILAEALRKLEIIWK